MNQGSIVGRLKLAEVEEFATPGRLRWLGELSDLYESDGLLSSRSAPALHEECDDRRECWKPLPDKAKPGLAASLGYARDRPGSIMWPWVGEQYDRGGVAIVGLNFRSDDREATVALEYRVAVNDRDDLRSGAFKSAFGSNFPYGRLPPPLPCSPA